MFTRDNAIWTLVAVTGLVTGLLANFDLLSGVGVGEGAKNWLALFAYVLAYVGGKLGTSPLNISDAGRVKEVAKQTPAEINKLQNAIDKVSVILLAVVLAGAVGLVGCATSQRARVAQGYQGTQLGLGAIQDAEMALYSSGTVPALTLQKHQQINRVFVKAFEAQIGFGNLLLAARNSPLPREGYAQWIAAIDATLKELTTLLPSDRRLLDATVAWVKNIVEMIRVIGETVPPELAAFAKR